MMLTALDDLRISVGGGESTGSNDEEVRVRLARIQRQPADVRSFAAKKKRSQ